MTGARESHGLELVQVAFCTDDISRSARLYSEVFGFAPSGTLPFWGEWLARLQDLGGDASAVITWLVGRQDFMQLEFFHHTIPLQRPASRDRTPADHGWVRWGLAVPDFDAAIERLWAAGVDTLAPAMSYRGTRRACFRDPHTRVVVEILEDSASLCGGRPAHYDLEPAVVYAAVSVPDLDPAARFLGELAGLDEVDDDSALHSDDCEALWGLPGARCRRKLLSAGASFLELVEYESPRGRPAQPGALLSDQGFMNVALGSRGRESVTAALVRMEAAGMTVVAPLPDWPAASTYVTGEGISLEIYTGSREFDPDFGFTPRGALVRPATWPETMRTRAGRA